ncbi:hypothetical protein [Planococcus sp. YIM B11945]|uniref:hypothetical protein n=1 Tax=Planococcus sp. YIM B11945 TaxID=3435410 RepID=UPI003D7E4945
MQIGKAQTIRITEIIAVIDWKNEVPAAFLRPLVPEKDIKSYIVTDDFVYGSPYRAQAIIKKIKERRL